MIDFSQYNSAINKAISYFHSTAKHGIDRDDLKQMALIVTWKALPYYGKNKNSCSLESFLITCIRRRIGQKLKRMSANKITATALLADIPYNNNYHDLKDEINKLNDYERNLLHMYYWENKSIVEICAQINIHKNTFYRHHNIIIEKLKRSLL